MSPGPLLAETYLQEKNVTCLLTFQPIKVGIEKFVKITQWQKRGW